MSRLWCGTSRKKYEAEERLAAIRKNTAVIGRLSGTDIMVLVSVHECQASFNYMAT